MTAAARLRRLMAETDILPMAGVFDALSGTLAEQAGLPLAYVSGYCVSATRLGRPDVGYLGLAELVETARRIAGRIGIPVVADGDDGYGNHLNTARLVRELEAGGIAGVQLEDQVSPKRCGHMAGKRVVPTGEMVAKIRAAADTRRDDDFLIIARTDAIAVTGFQDALERGAAYAEAGADAIFLEAPETIDQCRAIPPAFDKPTVFNWAWGGKSPLLTRDELAAMGFRFLQCPDTVFAVTRALRDVYGEVKRSGTYLALRERMTDFDEFNAVVGLDEVTALDTRYRAIAEERE
ncbi:2-methylisocitrate lyase-like PEP mutase family enzyme [Rhodobium orientis]|uniref:Carboxyvinyl-carboxyphosphonate phosphorylmutase n=1 Tax=Rhodobium orientis TaxID=34017 RepID=A0A327JRY0_9HYPH|nr:oxaloacetate decarboxylase [Rhodobium orientis]MBB4301420.1 2-methylisocitrate lyase-like PEP mutase family enzyme [Rhodobium orientis]MBK5950992.1 hypothetical protein [Rhodobium orientis]RAI27642.1 hypothetical protein CH339_09705 [Rhodobium orientis]